MLRTELLLILPLVVAVTVGQANRGYSYYGTSNVRDQRPQPIYGQRPLLLSGRPMPLTGLITDALEASAEPAPVLDAPLAPAASPTLATPSYAPVLRPRPLYTGANRPLLRPIIRPVPSDAAPSQPSPIGESQPPVTEAAAPLQPVEANSSEAPILPEPALIPIQAAQPGEPVVVEPLPEAIPTGEQFTQKSSAQTEPIRQPDPIQQTGPELEPEPIQQPGPEPQPEPIGQPGPEPQPEPIGQPGPEPQEPALQPEYFSQPEPTQEIVQAQEPAVLPERNAVPFPESPPKAGRGADTGFKYPTSPSWSLSGLTRSINIPKSPTPVALPPLLPIPQPVREPAFGRYNQPSALPMVNYPTLTYPTQTPSTPPRTVATQAPPVVVTKESHPAQTHVSGQLKFDFQCKEENGYYSIEHECDTFIECKQNRAMKFACPDGLHFNPAAKHCEYPCAYPSEVKCMAGDQEQNPKSTDKCLDQYGFYSMNDGDCSRLIGPEPQEPALQPEPTQEILQAQEPTVLPERNAVPFPESPPKPVSAPQPETGFRYPTSPSWSPSGLTRSINVPKSPTPVALPPLLPKPQPVREPAFGRYNQPSAPPMVNYPTLTYPTQTPSTPPRTVATQAPPVVVTKQSHPAQTHASGQLKFDFQCKEENGYYSVEYECDTYIECKQNRAMKFACPDGLHFNPAAKHYEYPCAYPSEVKCMAGDQEQNPKSTDKCLDQYGFYSMNDGDCSKLIGPEPQEPALQPEPTQEILQAQEPAVLPERNAVPFPESPPKPVSAPQPETGFRYPTSPSWSPSGLTRSINVPKSPTPVALPPLLPKPQPVREPAFGRYNQPSAPPMVNYPTLTYPTQTPSTPPRTVATQAPPVVVTKQSHPAQTHASGQLKFDFQCKEENGYYSVEYECDTYIECKQNRAMKFACPDGLHFNPAAKHYEYPCAYPSEVKCMAGDQEQNPKSTDKCLDQYGFYSMNDGDCSKLIGPEPQEPALQPEPTQEILQAQEPAVLPERNAVPFPESPPKSVSAPQPETGLRYPASPSWSPSGLTGFINVPKSPTPVALPPLLPKPQPVREPAFVRYRQPLVQPMINYPTVTYPTQTPSTTPRTVATQAPPVVVTKQSHPAPTHASGQLKFDFQCKEENGYYSVEHECDTFIECKQNRAMKYACPDGLHFKPTAKHCEYPCAYPSEVKCMAGDQEQNPKPTDKCLNQYGFYSMNDGDCSKYIMCQEGLATIMNCPMGLAFNPQTSTCDWPANVPQCNPNVFKDFTCPDQDGQGSDIIYKYRFGGQCKQYIACQLGHPRLLSCERGFSYDDASQACIHEDYVTDCSS